MKFISWNLRNIGKSKTDVNNKNYKFGKTFLECGLGNNLLDYVSKVATADPVWNNMQSTNPADVFVIIELKSGGSGDGRKTGQGRGSDAFGSCLTALPRFVNAMNTLVKDRKLDGSYDYKAVKPLIVGYHETVGVIYNTKSLTYQSSAVQYNKTTNKWIGDKSPFAVKFKALNIKDNPTLVVTGVHATPPGGMMPSKPPVLYNRQLVTTDAAKESNSFFMGDFNCNPGAYYLDLDADQIYPFTNLTGFTTPMFNSTYLSSMKGSLSGTYPYKNSDYLANAYDNVLRNVALTSPTVKVLDLLGNSRDFSLIGDPPAMEDHAIAVFNANSMVSDHMPVMIEF